MARLRNEVPQSATRLPQQSALQNQGDAEEDARAVAPILPHCDIFNTTFSLHRVSPMFVGREEVSSTYLETLSHRLRDTLVGDVVRGVEVGLEGGRDNAMGKAGLLEAVTIEWASADTILGTSNPALQLTLRYENALCSALLLPMVSPRRDNATSAGENASAAFLRLPLLLLRMPPPLKTVVAAFLETTFDCRIVPLRLNSSDLVRGWEIWAREYRLSTGAALVKDAVFTLAFRLPESKPARYASTALVDDALPLSGSLSLGVKTIDVIVPGADLAAFFISGQKHGQGQHGPTSTPFTEALAQYIKRHLALDMWNPAVAVVRIACDGFALSENRLKIFNDAGTNTGVSFTGLRGAVQQLISDLVTHADNRG